MDILILEQYTELGTLIIDKPHTDICRIYLPIPKALLKNNDILI